jgi:pimeloyl-ACP methyl ester carboxylesterase
MGFGSSSGRSGGRRMLPGGRYRSADEEVLLPEEGKTPSRHALRGARRIASGLLLVVLTVVVVVSSGLFVILYRYAHPPRVLSDQNPSALFTHYQDAAFVSPDGVSLTGWWLPGRDGLPAIILCHDLGSSRSSLMGLATRLEEAEYPILIFDFRGHGGSSGTSSFGVLEKRDLLGAIDWVGAHTKADGSRIGVVGVGMGAYASILAASERPQVRALVLDSPYPEASSQFAAASLPAGFLHDAVARWSRQIYDLVYRVHSSEENATSPLRGLGDRDLLFLAPKDREPVVQAVRGLFEAVPESRNNFKNLEILPATRTETLYDQDRKAYDDAVIGFFRSYLPPTVRAKPPASGRPHSDAARK